MVEIVEIKLAITAPWQKWQRNLLHPFQSFSKFIFNP